MGESSPTVTTAANSSCVQTFMDLIFVGVACPQKLIPTKISAFMAHCRSMNKLRFSAALIISREQNTNGLNDSL